MVIGGAVTVVSAFVAAFASPGARAARAAHPIHTTLTEVTLDPAHHAVRAVVRVFSDDLARAISHRESGAAPPTDAQSLAYAATAVRLSDAGSPVLLRGCGIQRSGDLLWICLEGVASGNGRGIELRDTMLCELFSDQVNIVQVIASGTKRSVLFTRGDGPKRLL